MKKLIIFLISFLISITLCLPLKNNFINEEYDISVMNEIRKYNDSYDEYELKFENEVLNLSNFKLKLALFNRENSYIKKVYIKYPNRVSKYFENKEYFSYNGNNLNEGIENVKNEYLEILNKNNLFMDLEQFTINSVPIESVVVISDSKTINSFKYKYPNVEVIKL